MCATESISEANAKAKAKPKGKGQEQKAQDKGGDVAETVAEAVHIFTGCKQDTGQSQDSTG